MFRGVNPQVPGRINHRSLNTFPIPVWGDISIQLYVEGRSISRSGPNTECKKALAPQYSSDSQLLEGEQSPFERLYQEACIERQPWGRTDRFMGDMMLLRPNRTSSGSAPPLAIQEATRELVPTGCVEGVCVSGISEPTREMFCEYFKSIRETTEEEV